MGRNLSIMFLLRFFPEYGGGEMVTLKLADEFVNRGYNVSIAFLWDSCDLSRFDDYKIIRIIDGSTPIGQDNIKSNEIRLIQESLTRIISKERPDIIINQWLPPRIVYKANQNFAYIVTCKHSAIYINSIKWNVTRKIFGEQFKYLLRIYYHEQYKYSSKWVLLCEQFVNEARDIFSGDKGNKITYIYNPCRYDIKELSIDNIKKENIVLYVGRIYKEKRVDVLLRIWKKVEEEVYSKWKFIIIGNGKELANCKRLCRELDCKSVTFMGRMDPKELYKKAKIFLSASETEGFPMTLVEAMSYGVVPIVMDTYSSVRDVVRPGCGVITKNDVQDFKSKMVQTLENEKYIQEISKNARGSVDRFKSENVVKNWISLFEEFYGRASIK